MEAEATAPTLEEFVSTARAEFSFLAEYGFAEVPQPSAQYQNPFEVHYQRKGWRVVVEGLSYGFCACVRIDSPDGRRAAFGHIVPKEYWSAHRQGLGRGQLGDIRYQAMTLRAFGMDFLGGDESLMDELCRRTEDYIEQDREYWRKRDMDRAVASAADAFQSGDYPEVIRLLEEHEDALPRAQVAKLVFARKKTNG
jgi:hypothetical protein